MELKIIILSQLRYISKDPYHIYKHNQRDELKVKEELGTWP